MLNKGSLVSDCEGIIEQIALALPDGFFHADAEIWLGGPLLPIGNLLQSFPSEMEVLLAVSAQSYSSAFIWIEAIRPRCQIKFICDHCSTLKIGSPWLQDRFHVRVLSGAANAASEILSLENDPLAALFAKRCGLLHRTLKFDLPGGNQLVGPGFRVIGSSFIQEPAHGAAFAKDDIARDQFMSLDSRELHVFGYDPTQLAMAKRPSIARDAKSVASDFLRAAFAGEERARIMPWHQYGFHIDQFVSVTGVMKNGRSVVLVAEPQPIGANSKSFAIDARKKLNLSCVALEDAGFTIIRNPVPFAPARDSRKVSARLFNNVIVESVSRKGCHAPFVWIPSFEQHPEFREFEEANVRIWDELGFSTKIVSGFDIFVSRNGAVRCLTKVIKRNLIN